MTSRPKLAVAREIRGRARVAKEPTARWLRARLLTWFEASGRDFPWRRQRTPYEVLIAELLLQRTRADLVEPFYDPFIRRYPNAFALAEADPDEVVDVLRPLGFLHRSRRLPQLGHALVDRHGGQIPTERAALLDRPGVGPYVANVVLSLCFGQRLPLLDPNVIRVVGRVFEIQSGRARPRDDPALWEFIGSMTPKQEAAKFGLALVDLGALICRPRLPLCPACPLNARCKAFRTGAVQPGDAAV